MWLSNRSCHFRKHHAVVGLAPRASVKSIRNFALREDDPRVKPEGGMREGLS